MPGPIVTTSSTGVCSHGGQMIAAGTSARVLILGQPAVKATDIHPIAACPFNVSGAPSPCVTATQFVPAVRVLFEGQPAVLQTSIGLGMNAAQAPQGPVTMVSVQPRVIGM